MIKKHPVPVTDDTRVLVRACDGYDEDAIAAIVARGMEELGYAPLYCSPDLTSQQ